MATGQLAESGRRPLRLGGIPVFMYHGLTTSRKSKIPWRERKYWVLPGQFREQLNCILQEGYQVALLREVWNPTNAPNREKPTVALTFDDGRWSDYTVVYPFLLQSGVRAEFFVNTSTIGQQGFLGWQQITEMHRAGMSFQSHSHDHVDLSRLPSHGQERQMKDSKQMLEDRLGSSVDFLAAPYGLISLQVVDMALRVGYRAVCSSRSWPAQPGARTLNRVIVYGHTSLRDFQRLAAGSLVAYAGRAARTALLYLPQRVLLCFWQPQLGVTLSEDQPA